MSDPGQMERQVGRVALVTGAARQRGIGGAIATARAVVFLASTDAAFITGQRLDVDGGQDLR
jgi:NAD(P)-dependent dehydrogenase (short-subunit alcohol dehydrogenase family)